MSKVLFLIAQTNFRDEELLEPKTVLESAGINCSVASITTETATGKLGLKITPDLAIKDAKIEDYSAIILVGGPGAPALADYPEVIDLLKKGTELNKIIAAICIAPIILAKANLVAGKKLTVFSDPEAISLIQNSGGTVLNESVVEDGNLITGNGPESAKEFGEKLKKKTLGKKHDK